jgi:hypothetical protein
VGGPVDNSHAGTTWVFTRSKGIWTQQGGNLVGTGTTGKASEGISVSLSADGTTALVGGHFDDSNIGAAWVFIPATITSSVKANISADKPNIYPNPTNGLVTLDTPEGKITVLDMEGKVLIETKLGKDKTIDLSKYASGMYILILKSKGSIYEYKVMKQ